MQKWRVEFYGSVDVETESLNETDALRAGFVKLAADGAGNHLFADADPILAGEITGGVVATEEETIHTNGVVAHAEIEAKP
jgi:hypothetical protein